MPQPGRFPYPSRFKRLIQYLFIGSTTKHPGCGLGHSNKNHDWSNQVDQFELKLSNQLLVEKHEIKHLVV
jgi:hypothetical protein